MGLIKQLDCQSHMVSLHIWQTSLVSLVALLDFCVQVSGTLNMSGRKTVTVCLLITDKLVPGLQYQFPADMMFLLSTWLC